MRKQVNKVENLTQITLTFQAGTTRESMDLTPKYPGLKLIFGIGSEGMSAFECELEDKVDRPSEDNQLLSVAVDDADDAPPFKDRLIRYG